MLKEKIKANFNRAAADYESVASVQERAADCLIQCLNEAVPDLIPQKILDIGAGTGIVTKKLMSKFPATKYILSDLSPRMLEIAQSQLCERLDIDYIVGDAENLVFQPVDLMISSLSFQWFADLEGSLNKLWQDTEILAFSTLSKGTFFQWERLYQTLELTNCKNYDYPTKKMLETYCLDLSPKKYLFQNKIYKLTFDDALSFVKYLKHLGANTPSSKAGQDCLRLILKAKKDSFTISYKVFFAVLIK
ncbi:MAG: methyltransferase domain-containing protein [Janthinobacterium lividum]